MAEGVGRVGQRSGTASAFSGARRISSTGWNSQSHQATSRTDGQVSILTDDMEVAGELVQDMCAYLTITEQVLNSGRFGH